jgi:seryl-tRNA synthetase
MDSELDSNMEYDLSDIQYTINEAASQTKRNFERLSKIVKEQESELKRAAASKKRTLTSHRTKLKDERQKTGGAFTAVREANKRRIEVARNNEELQNQLTEATQRNEELQRTVATLRAELAKARGVTCPVCYDQVVEIAAPCGHCFCKVCHEKWAIASISEYDRDDIEFVDENHAEQVEGPRMSCPFCRKGHKKDAILKLIIGT